MKLLEMINMHVQIDVDLSAMSRVHNLISILLEDCSGERDIFDGQVHVYLTLSALAETFLDGRIQQRFNSFQYSINPSINSLSPSFPFISRR